MRMRILDRGLILVGVPLLIGLALVGSFYVLMQKAEYERIQESRLRKFTSLTVRLSGEVIHGLFLETMGMLTPDSKTRVRRRNQNLQKLHSTFAELKDYKAHYPGSEEVERAKWVTSCFNDIMQDWDASFTGLSRWQPYLTPLPAKPEQRKQHYQKPPLALILTETGKLESFGDEQTRLVEHRLEKVNREQRLLLTIAIVANLVMSIGLGLFFRRGILQRIQTIAQNTRFLAAGAPLCAKLKGSDEIAQLDESFHQMNLQLRNAQENEKKLFNNASDVICVLNNENKFLRVSPASKSNWEYEPAELLGLDISCLIDASSLSSALETIANCKLSEKPVTFSANMHTQSGAKQVGLWSAYWSKAEDSLFCVVHDITESQRIANMRARFLCMISSDLKIPLAHISQAAQRVLSFGPELPASASTKFSAAVKNVTRLIGLVDDLLQIAEMDRGMLKLQREECDLFELLNRAKQELEYLAQKKGLTIELQPCQHSVFVQGDRIVQVLVNYLSNAIKFSPERKVITISTERKGNMVICQVTDQGRGVPADKLTAVFEKFTQVESADGKRKAGTGLGLPICKRIIESHGGRVGVESEEGKGSTFWFSVPAERTELAALPDALTDSQEKSSALSPTSEGISPHKSTVSTDPVNPAKARRIPLYMVGLSLVAVPLLFEIAFVASLSWSLLDLQQERKRELHQRNIATNAGKLLNLTFAAISTIIMPGAPEAMASGEPLRQDLLNTAPGADTLARRELIGQEAENILASLSSQLSADRRSKKCLEQLNKAILKLRNFEKRYSSGQLQNPLEVLQMLPAILSLSSNISEIIERAEAVEFASPEKELAMRRDQANILLAGLLANLAISLALAKQFSSSISRRLAVMADNAGRAARLEPLNPLIGGNDELSDLDKSFHEVTAALAESRRKESAVFDNCKDVLCTITAGGKFISTNPAAESMWGYDRREFTEIAVFSLLVPEEWESMQKSLLSEADKDKVIEQEFRMLRKDGSVIYCLWSASKLKDQNEIFCTVHDVTDQKELEQLRKEFLALVSHDLRTPLTAVMGIAELAEAGAFGELPTAAKSSVTEILKNADSLLELINDILDLEKLDAGKMELHFEETHLEAIISQLSDKLRDLATSAISLSGEALDKPFAADRDRLCQAIANLAGFLQLRGANGSVVQISAKRSSAGVCIKLLDSGPLIPEYLRPRIFDRFNDVSLDQDLRESNFHADLRVPLAAKIIECHSGTVQFAEGERSSNCCIINIPVRKQILSSH